jgi:galactosylceramidase
MARASSLAMRGILLCGGAAAAAAVAAPYAYVYPVSDAAGLGAAAAAAGLGAAAAAAAAPYTYPVSDAGGLGRTFEGIGAISGGGATSRLLMDYDPDVLSDIMDYLYLPNFGASLHILKVEIGGEADTTNGAEASHMRDADPANANFARGYEWKLMVEAKKRNPDVLLYGLPWSWPGWVGVNGTQDPWGDISRPISYITTWLEGARDTYNLTIDYIGSWK